ncbi:elongation factor Ts [Nitzschia inconspicua]|uniref:Elongation factor Ts, mitochondrial n=1 Tax=Nitzschia inconspicua TaxID=303405 RepID=A0A9K3LL27_9STRA|nr:elongation factor Ts [Nitzschia inconspicua]
MRLVSTVALAVFLATSTTTEAFGPAQPLHATSAYGTGGSVITNNNNNHGMTMRIGTQDMKRKQRLNRILDANPTKETVQDVLLGAEMSTMIQKCSWKVRKNLIRKVQHQADRYELTVDPTFGVPPTQEEREAQSKVAGAERKAARAAEMQAAKEHVQAMKEARVQKRAESKAKTAAHLEKMKALKQSQKPPAKEEPTTTTIQKESPPEPVVAAEAVSEPAPAPAVEEPAPAPAASNAVTPKIIKELRDSTGAGMMDCKKALLETDGDMEAAAEYLRKKGLAKADKKASRVAAEGRIAFANENGKAVMVEVNCETDFVGKDSNFLEFAEKVATSALSLSDDNVESLLSQEVDGETLETTRQALVAKIGENIQVRRMASRGGSADTVVGGYVHMNSIGVLVELEGGDEQLCTDIAMHITAMNPPYAVPEDVPSEVLEKEKQILSAQALESGKPPEIVEKMVEGRIRKYLEEICLVSQAYVKDGDKTVGKLLEEKGAKMVGFTRIAVGEGIEKKEDDFAAEVAKMAGKPPPAPEASSPSPEVSKEDTKDEATPEPAKPSGGGAVTPKTIKALRDATGAGMMDAKKALLESNGDPELAAEYLRKKGLATADKKAARVAAEGKIAIANSGNKAVMVEINCETDFVAKDDNFLGFCDKVASAAVDVAGDSVTDLMSMEADGETLEATRQAMVAKIGENIQVRRMASRGGDGSTVGAYVHMNRLGVIVELEGGTKDLCIDIAMHIAAMNPPYATSDDVPAEVLEKEKEILTDQALQSGKPPEIVEKMVEGRIRKYLEEICLVSQSYVKDSDRTVGKLLEDNGAKIIGFTRLAVGEGIEKKTDDFAAEVAKMAGTKEPAPV